MSNKKYQGKKEVENKNIKVIITILFGGIFYWHILYFNFSPPIKGLIS